MGSISEENMDRSEKVINIVVAVLTCERPDALIECLQSLAAMDEPQNTTVTLLVVDNAPPSAAGKVVEALKNDCFYALEYIGEAERGISVARNCALDFANKRNADFLAFVDDDELVATDWLVALTDCWRETGAELIGGPVYVTDPVEQASWWQRLVNRSLQARAIQKMAQTARSALSTGKYTIVTNNWLCDLNWQRRHNIRFDYDLRFTGGEDTKFFRDSKQLNCQTHWCDDAKIYETQSLDRLSLGYQFRRASAQALNHFRMKHGTVNVKNFLLTVPAVMIKMLSGIALFLIPVFGVASLVAASRSIGWAVGRTKALFGNLGSHCKK